MAFSGHRTASIVSDQVLGRQTTSGTRQSFVAKHLDHWQYLLEVSLQRACDRVTSAKKPRDLKRISNTTHAGYYKTFVEKMKQFTGKLL